MEKRSPLGNSLFPLLVPVSVFSTLYGKKKKKRGKKKKEGERTKEQTLNNFILDRSQLSTNYDDASVPRTNEQPCKGNKGRTKREREEKKRKKREKKRHTYRSTKSIINTIVSGPEKKPLCITLYVYTHPFIYGGDPLVALMLIPKAVQRRGVGPRDCSCGSSCQRLVTVTPD